MDLYEHIGIIYYSNMSIILFTFAFKNIISFACVLYFTIIR